MLDSKPSWVVDVAVTLAEVHVRQIGARQRYWCVDRQYVLRWRGDHGGAISAGEGPATGRGHRAGRGDGAVSAQDTAGDGDQRQKVNTRSR